MYNSPLCSSCTCAEPKYQTDFKGTGNIYLVERGKMKKQLWHWTYCIPSAFPSASLPIYFSVMCMSGWEKQGKESKFWASAGTCRWLQRRQGQTLPCLRQQRPHPAIFSFKTWVFLSSLTGGHLWKEGDFPLMPTCQLIISVLPSASLSLSIPSFPSTSIPWERNMTWQEGFAEALPACPFVLVSSSITSV